MADIPADYLDAVARAWVRKSVFMPKAAELIALAEEMAAANAQDTRTLAQKYNDRMAQDPLARPDRKWIDTPNGPKLVPK
ncbi:hypothetical protein [Sphingomonas sp. BE137]|uniref:hypothetical protein n=1 Tax=Sphingomonas sp. BE137 TaxID=2817844 RepID=UPI001AEB9280|nr:hypothetical protein [Sphingomonas sp. BE137]MDR6850343.1 hypothetical protein [Sphingomonas sp. BE137]